MVKFEVMEELLKPLLFIRADVSIFKTIDGFVQQDKYAYFKDYYLCLDAYKAGSFFVRFQKTQGQPQKNLRPILGKKTQPVGGS